MGTSLANTSTMAQTASTATVRRKGSIKGKSHNVRAAGSSRGVTRASSERIRSDLFHKLGIESESHDRNTKKITSTRSLLGDVQTYSEPLKYNDEEEGEETKKLRRMRSTSWTSFFQSSSSSPTTVVTEEKPKKPRRKLSFDDQVKVIPIPMADDYSNRIRERLWINVNELELGAYRNAVEFTAEGWDWRTVTEDDAMYTCSETGEKIHPVHIEPQATE